MSIMYLVVAEFMYSDVALSLCETEELASNLCESYADDFNYMWFNNESVHDCSEVEFRGTYFVKFVNGVRQPKQADSVYPFVADCDDDD